VLSLAATGYGGRYAFSHQADLGTYDLDENPLAQAFWPAGFVLSVVPPAGEPVVHVRHRLVLTAVFVLLCGCVEDVAATKRPTLLPRAGGGSRTARMAG
jgi:hypothetical protein